MTRNIPENDWLIKTRNRMKKRMREGKTTYVQNYMARPSYNEPAEPQSRYLKLENVYDRFALFSTVSLFGKTRECYTYDIIRETMSEA